MTNEWRGKQVKAKVIRATKKGIDSVTTDCVKMAKGLVHVRFSILQGSIEMRPAKQIGNKIYGLFGSWSVRYAIYQELEIFRGSKPYLRPAADAYFPQLRKRIKGYLN